MLWNMLLTVQLFGCIHELVIMSTPLLYKYNFLPTQRKLATYSSNRLAWKPQNFRSRWNKTKQDETKRKGHSLATVNGRPLVMKRYRLKWHEIGLLGRPDLLSTEVSKNVEKGNTDFQTQNTLADAQGLHPQKKSVNKLITLNKVLRVGFVGWQEVMLV